MNIIYENEDFLVLDKPAGLVVNRSKTIKEETLQDQLAKYFQLKAGDFGIGERAGIVHRLDRETSGVLVVAKTQKTFDYLQEEFKNRRVKKEYTALVHGSVKDKFGEISSQIIRIGKFGKFGNLKNDQTGGRVSETDFSVVGKFELGSGSDPELTQQGRTLYEIASINKNRENYLRKNAKYYTLLSVFPKTGRTHQIRVHLKSIGHPVVSDLIYAPSKLLKFDLIWCPRLFLHAQKIKFRMKTEGKIKEFVFESPLPYDLEEAKKFLVKLPHEPGF